FELTGLGGLGLYAAHLMFGGCNREGPQAPFAVWEEMITALEQSPDHLAGRRKALVAAGDPLKMIEFVRDSFQLLPDEINFLTNSDRLQGFGTKSAVRCDWAPPQEKPGHHRRGCQKHSLSFLPTGVRSPHFQTTIENMEGRHGSNNAQRPSHRDPHDRRSKQNIGRYTAGFHNGGWGPKQGKNKVFYFGQ